MDHNLEKSVIIYRSEDGTIQLEVQLYNGTVWMNRQQMSTLFGRDVKTIGKHINNALNEELKNYPTVAKFATLQKEGNRIVNRDIDYYSLDMVLSVGYRVKSQRGIDYRHWANEKLKDYLLKSHAVNNRLDRLEVKVYKLEEKTKEMETEIKGQLLPHEGVFYDGQIFDAYTFISDLKLDLSKHNSQYQPITIEHYNKSHDRFLIIDDDVYLIGGSIKDLGKKVSTFVKLSVPKGDFLFKLLN